MPLWDLVLDERLIIMKRVVVYTQAYDDDFIILVGGKYGGGGVFDLVHLVLSTTEKWCIKVHAAQKPELY